MDLTGSSRFGRNLLRLAVLAALVAPMIAACGGGGVGSSGVKRGAFTSKEFGVAVSPRVTKAKYPPRGGGRELPLRSYVVRGKTYSPVEGPGYVERGHASWYGQDFHGRRTANGEIFGAFYLTAASPVLPIPSYARVTNLENGRSVLVRVNDRGPYLQGRVIDLSFQAASVLGYINQGSAQVEVRYVAPAPLNGDDNKMLMATVNRLTALEQQTTRIARVEPQEVAPQRAVDPFASQEPAYRPNMAFGYANSDPVSAAHAAANAMASRDTGLDDWVEVVDEDALDIKLQLGVFRDEREAVQTAEAFAMLGAVDEAMVEIGGDPAATLTLTHLKPGVARADVLALARELGLNDIILY